MDKSHLEEKMVFYEIITVLEFPSTLLNIPYPRKGALFIVNNFVIDYFNKMEDAQYEKIKILN